MSPRTAHRLSSAAIVLALASPRFAAGAPEQTGKAPAAPAPSSPSKKTSSSPSSSSQKVFSSPKAAAEALISAAAAVRRPGPHRDPRTGRRRPRRLGGPRPVQEHGQPRSPRKGLEKHSVVTDPKNASRMILTIGDEDWPTPIPIVEGRRKAGGSTRRRARRRSSTAASDATSSTRSRSAADTSRRSTSTPRRSATARA